MYISIYKYEYPSLVLTDFQDQATARWQDLLRGSPWRKITKTILDTWNMFQHYQPKSDASSHLFHTLRCSFWDAKWGPISPRRGWSGSDSPPKCPVRSLPSQARVEFHNAGRKLARKRRAKPCETLLAERRVPSSCQLAYVKLYCNS